MPITRILAGWGQYPKQACLVTRPKKYQPLPLSSTTIARGQGRSYGDAALNKDGQVLLTEHLDRLLAFDKVKGVITAEAGITLAELLPIIIPVGWFLPVTPGTQFVSLGGCVATDVHGKNHHCRGSFCQSVINIELITAEQQRITCSPEHNADYFWATIGGMGLTGIIGTVTLQLMPISSIYLAVKHYATANFEQTFHYLNATEYDDEYSVAWLDAMTTGNAFGRGIVMTAHHLAANDLTMLKPDQLLAPIKRKTHTVPLNCPSWLINQYSIKTFNAFYYAAQSKKIYYTADYKQFFYPLDTLQHWNRLYGNKGFLQYQCVLPLAQAYQGLQAILKKLQQHTMTVTLAVLKRFGASKGGLLSFPMPGYTLALDIPLHNPQIFNILDEIDAMVIQYGGKVYLAKDSRLNAKHFRQMYANYPAWLAIKNQLDPNSIFNSSLAQRLAIGKI